MLNRVKDQKHTIHENYYVSLKNKFLKYGVRSLSRVVKFESNNNTVFGRPIIKQYLKFGSSRVNSSF